MKVVNEVSDEVVRRVKGRDYLYRIDSVPDVATGRLRRKWIYLGRHDGTTLRRARRRSSTSARDRIVRATIELLASRDAEFLTVDVIARAAKLSRATFYRQFADRERALGAALAAYVETTDAALPGLESIDRSTGERARLGEWVAALLERLGEHPTLLRLLVATPAWYEPLLAVLARYLEERRARGDVACADIEVLARGIMLVVEGALVRGVLAAYPSDALDVAPAVAQRLVFGA